MKANKITSTTPAIVHWTRIGFSGHRQIQRNEVIEQSIGEVLRALRDEFNHVTTYSSAASGADTLFLEQAFNLNIPSRVVLPFPLAKFKSDFNTQDWKRVSPLIDRAFEIGIIDDCESDEECYLEASHLTVENCDILLVVWNGRMTEKRGGTFDTLTHARNQKKKIIIIHADSGAVTTENMPLPQGNPAAEVTAPELNHDWHEMVERAYDHFNSLASDSARICRLLVIVIVGLHVLASAGAVFVIVYFPSTEENFFPKASDWFKILALSLALICAALHRKHHHRLSETRPRAEICRFFLAIWPFKRKGLPQSFNDFLGQSQDIRDLSTAWQLDKAAQVSLADAKKHYRESRINDQLQYYKSQLKPQWKYWLFNEKLIFLMTTSAILCATLHLSHFLPSLDKTAKFLTIILPALAAALYSISLGIDHTRRASKYFSMTGVLAEADFAIKAAATWPAIWRAAEKLEYQLLNEVEDWQSIQKVSHAH